MVKIKWRVCPKATGRYASFNKRNWPHADWSNSRPAGFVHCVDSYTPARSRGEDSHADLHVWVALYTKDGSTFNNRRLKNRAKNLNEAKKLLQEFLEKNPDYRPVEYRK